MGPSHDFTIAAITSIAVLFRDQSQLSEALTWYTLALTRTESSPRYREGDPATISAVESVAITLNLLQRFDEALPFFLRVLAGMEAQPRKTRGKENLETVIVVSDIGGILDNLDRHEEALVYLRRALAGLEAHAIDKKHYYMIDVLYPMATSLVSLGKVVEAIGFFKRVVLADPADLRARDAVKLVHSFTTIAAFLETEYRHAEALIYYRRGLSLVESLPQFGKKHPTTLEIVNQIGNVLDSLDEFSEGLECYQRVIAAQLPGETTLTAISGMASVLRGAGSYDQSLVCYRMSLDGHETSFGKEDLRTLFVASNMATLQYMRKDYEEALRICRYVIEIEERQGKDVITVKAAGTMAMAYEGQGKDEEALKWYQRSLAGYQKDGAENIGALQMVRCIGLLLCRQKKYEEAMKYFNRALAGFELVGKDYRFTYLTIGNIAELFGKQGRYEEAVTYHERALAGQEKVLGRRHIETLDTIKALTLCYDNLGALCYLDENLDKSLSWYGRALSHRERILPRGHPDILDTVSTMAVIFDKQGRWKAALDFHQRALRGREKELGSEHADTVESARCVAEMKKHFEV